MKLIRLLIFSVFVLIAFQLSAQDFYRAEIGINGGGSYYLGEGNRTLFTNIQPAFSGFIRYRFDPRFAARIELTSATAAGTGFKNPVFAVDLCGEFNFFDFEKNQYKRFSKTFTPYIFAGLGMMSYNNNLTSTVPGFAPGFAPSLAPSIPFGIGMKVKMGDRFNLNLQWATRLLLADNLENVVSMNNPSDLNGTNRLNNDFLSTFTVGISFDFWKKECDCQNAAVRKDSHKYKKK